MARGRPPVGVVAPEAALQELLGSRASACTAGGPDVVAAFGHDSISWPRTAGVVDLASVLPEADRQDLTDVGGRLTLNSFDLDSEEDDCIYWDQTLRKGGAPYEHFVRSLAERKMVVFRKSCACSVGVFFVRKKMGLFV